MNAAKSGMIAKHFTRIRQAERYQERLCDKYESVQLVRCPLSEEDGLYVWEVKQTAMRHSSSLPRRS